jgi:hypothetical protein
MATMFCKSAISLALLLVITGCSNPNVAATLDVTVTSTQSPTPTLILTIIPTETPIPTQAQTVTPSPIYVSLGSPFASDCGDGVPVIWAMNSYNAPDPGKVATSGGRGHSDLLPPYGCNPSSYDGEIIMTNDGTLSLHQNRGAEGNTYDLALPRNTYLLGTLDALEFAGVKNPELHKINSIFIRIGHIVATPGSYSKGEKIGDIVYDTTVPKNPEKLAFEIRIKYNGIVYMLSPLLFISDVDYICPPVNNGCIALPPVPHSAP